MACFHVAIFILVSVVGFEITVFASSGIGSTLHVAGELFKMMAGVDIVHVPYRGGAPALVDLMSGRVQLMFDNVPTSLEFIKAGKLRPLAVTSAVCCRICRPWPIS